MASAAQASTRRRFGLAALVAGVTLAHWLLGLELGDNRLGEGAADRAPKLIDVAFVRELAPSLPPVAAAALPVLPPPTQVMAAAPTASAVSGEGGVEQPAASNNQAADAAPAIAAEPVLAPELAMAEAEAGAGASAPDEAVAAASDAASATPPLASASAPALLAAAAASSPASAAAAPVALASAPAVSAAPPPNAAAAQFDWPPSTRLSYRLEGQYRGPLYGTAKVEWLREGQHYQVRLTVEVSPVFSRRMLSDGVLGPWGLSPRRYDEETDVTLRGTRRATVLFQPDQILLANGKTAEPARGVQDAASQFVQLSWLFLTRPELLRVGQSVEFPLALPRRMGRWAYDVTERVTLRLPFGEVETWRLQPQPGSRKGNELSVEMWIAPSLQYLPVRIALQQDAETHLELNLESRPLQAAPTP